jgi:hypothetical protein
MPKTSPLLFEQVGANQGINAAGDGNGDGTGHSKKSWLVGRTSMARGGQAVTHNSQTLHFC